MNASPAKAGPRGKEHWFRSFHGAPDHPKWLLVADRAGVKPSLVVAVVWKLLDYASQHVERGSVAGFDVEVCASYLREDPDDVDRVIAVLSGTRRDGRAMFITGDQRIGTWEERQPAREREYPPDGAQVRQEQRAKKRERDGQAEPPQRRQRAAASGGVAPSPAVSDQIEPDSTVSSGVVQSRPVSDRVGPREEEMREEKNQNPPLPPLGALSPAAPADDDDAALEHVEPGDRTEAAGAAWLTYDGFDDLCDRIWNPYPRKSGLEAFRSALWSTLGDGVEPALILRGLERDRRKWAEEQTPTRYIPTLGTYLAEQRWTGADPAELADQGATGDARAAVPDVPIEIQKIRAGYLCQGRPDLADKLIERLGGPQRAIAAVRAFDRRGEMVGTALVSQIEQMFGQQERLKRREPVDAEAFA